MPLFDGAGVIGCGDDEPEPVVLGGVTVREAVVVGGQPLFAVIATIGADGFSMGDSSGGDSTVPTRRATRLWSGFDSSARVRCVVSKRRLPL